MQNLHLTFDCMYCSEVKISQNFVAFSEYMNFTASELSHAAHWSSGGLERVEIINDIYLLIRTFKWAQSKEQVPSFKRHIVGRLLECE